MSEIISNSLNEITKRIKREMFVLQDQLDLIDSIDFNTYAPTEAEWHDLMETPIRNNKPIVEQMIKNIFPIATDIVLGANYAFFNLHGVLFGYSISRINEIIAIGKAKDIPNISYLDATLAISKIKEYRDNNKEIQFCDITRKTNPIYLKEYVWLSKTNNNTQNKESVDADKIKADEVELD